MASSHGTSARFETLTGKAAHLCPPSDTVSWDIVFCRYSKDPTGRETCNSVWIDTILVQDDEATSVMLEDRAVVLDIPHGSYFDFNRVGSKVWAMLAAPCRIGDIFDTLFRTHNVGMDVIQCDVTAFLRTLINRKLVRVIRRRDLP